MTLEQLVMWLSLPMGILTAIMQALKQIPLLEKYKILTVLVAVTLGPATVWLFSELVAMLFPSTVDLGSLSLKTQAALGVVVGLASVGLFELGNKIPGVNQVVK